MKFSPLKIGSAILAVGLLGYFAFTYQLDEGQNALVLRFGAPRSVQTHSGLHWRLPRPFEEVVKLDCRRQHHESAYLETLTKDKKNIVLQTWMTWKIADPLKFFVTVGDFERAQRYLDALSTDSKNSLLGNYPLSSLLNLDPSQLRHQEIEDKLCQAVAQRALERYGIKVEEVKIKRLGFPSSNLASVLDQMAADRNKLVVQLNAEGERDASLIRGEADVKAAQIRAEGKEKAAQIRAQTEAETARIYGEAHKKNPDLYQFLTKLRLLEMTVDESTTFITTTKEAPFDILEDKPNEK